jgi:hypothetical protein
MKCSLPPPPGLYTGVYVGGVPQWCITNQRHRRVMLDFKRVGMSYQRGRAASNAGLSERGQTSMHGLGALHGLGAGNDAPGNVRVH